MTMGLSLAVCGCRALELDSLGKHFAQALSSTPLPGPSPADAYFEKYCRCCQMQAGEAWLTSPACCLPEVLESSDRDFHYLSSKNDALCPVCFPLGKTFYCCCFEVIKKQANKPGLLYSGWSVDGGLPLLKDSSVKRCVCRCVYPRVEKRLEKES